MFSLKEALLFFFSEVFLFLIASFSLEYLVSSCNLLKSKYDLRCKASW